MSYDKNLEKLFNKNKILTYSEVKEKIGCCLTTLSRFGDKHGYYSSCNNNGKYYILAKDCTFNEHGLYVFKGVIFSKNLTLKNSILNAIDNSKAGMTTEELSTIYGKSTGVSISHMYTKKQLARTFIDNTFYYFSSDREVQSHQKDLREKLSISISEGLCQKDLPSSDKIIAVLTIIVGKTTISPKSLQTKLIKKGVRLSIDEIKRIFAYYELSSKKNSNSKN